MSSGSSTIPLFGNTSHRKRRTMFERLEFTFKRYPRSGVSIVLGNLSNRPSHQKLIIWSEVDWHRCKIRLKFLCNPRWWIGYLLYFHFCSMRGKTIYGRHFQPLTYWLLKLSKEVLMWKSFPHSAGEGKRAVQLTMLWTTEKGNEFIC